MRARGKLARLEALEEGCGKLLDAGKQKDPRKAGDRLLYHFPPRLEGGLLVVTTVASGNSGAGRVMEIRQTSVQVEKALNSLGKLR